MALILNIDCAVETASISLNDNEVVIGFEQSSEQKNHGSFLQPAIQNIFRKTNFSLNKIDAVSVTTGPGSYTGLRVGLASAKGICYALQKPLISVNTLEIMAYAAIKKIPDSDLFCPMIDARRIEVFTALYDADLNMIMPPSAIILTENSFSNELKTNRIVFSGNGSIKFSALQNSTNAVFANVGYNATDLNFFSQKKYMIRQFEDIAYINPFYLKDFFTPFYKQ